MVLAHLEKLHDTLEAPDGRTVHVWWIYAKPRTEHRHRPPTDTDYERFHASSEGVACVDDVARAAVVYLDHHDIHGDDHSLERARQALEFLQYMQRDDGRFLNFVVDPDLTETVFGEANPDEVEGIRVNGSPTSAPSYGWWATRACWALGEGFRTFADADPDFGSELAECLDAYLDVIEAERLDSYGEYAESRGIGRPTWLINDAYTTAPAVLGLAASVRASGDDRRTVCLRKLADGLADTGRGDAITPPFGAHLDTQPGEAWHTWGLRQVPALARAGDVLDEDAYVESARREVAALHSHHAASHNQIGSFGPTPLPYHQLSYGTDALVQGCTELWRATGERGFAQLGAQIATWYLGNNVEHVRMWDPDAGRGYDGIYRDAIDWKAGAESTIAAARTALDRQRYPDAVRLDGECKPHDDRPFTTAIATECEVGDSASRLDTSTGGSVLAGAQVVKIFEGGELTVSPDLESGYYRPYLVYERTIAPDARALVWIDDEVQTLDVGGGSEAYYQMTPLDPVAVEEDATVELSFEGASDRSAKVDAIVFQPALEYRVAEADDGAGVVVRSFVDEQRAASVSMPNEERWTIDLHAFDADGVPVEEIEDHIDPQGRYDVPVEPYGFSVGKASPAE